MESGSGGWEGKVRDGLCRRAWVEYNLGLLCVTCDAMDSFMRSHFIIKGEMCLMWNLIIHITALLKRMMQCIRTSSVSGSVNTGSLKMKSIESGTYTPGRKVLFSNLNR